MRQGDKETRRENCKIEIIIYVIVNMHSMDPLTYSSTRATAEATSMPHISPTPHMMINYINTVHYMVNSLFRVVNPIKSLVFYYILWITLHYICAHMYPELCAPKTIYGFVITPFIVSAPHCVAMRWVIYEGSNLIHTMWIVFGTWITSRLL